MTEVAWIVVGIIIMLITYVLCAVGMYKAGYAKGYLASHEIVLEMNENYMKMSAIAMEYERELKELKESYRYSQPPGVR